MSTTYKSSRDVPTEVLAARLNELADVVAKKHYRIGDEFTMRIPAECDRDADLVMSEAARRMQAMSSDLEHARMRIKELDLLFGRYVLGMKAAVIEAEHGAGAESGMTWIWNGLAGPGELPPDDETDAQAFFDREIKAINEGMSEVMDFYRDKRTAKQEPKQ